MKNELNIDFRATTTSRRIRQRQAKKALLYPLFQRGLGGFSSKFHILDRGYTGHEHLLDHDIINMNGRIYDPIVGQFMQADNVIQSPEDFISYNRYSYCLFNPFKYTDPSGEAILLGPGILSGSGQVPGVDIPAAGGTPVDGPIVDGPIVGCEPRPNGWVDPPGPDEPTSGGGGANPDMSSSGRSGMTTIQTQTTGVGSWGNGGGGGFWQDAGQGGGSFGTTRITFYDRNNHRNRTFDVPNGDVNDFRAIISETKSLPSYSQMIQLSTDPSFEPWNIRDYRRVDLYEIAGIITSTGIVDFSGAADDNPDPNITSCGLEVIALMDTYAEIDGALWILHTHILYAVPTGNGGDIDFLAMLRKNYKLPNLIGITKTTNRYGFFTPKGALGYLPRNFYKWERI